MKLSELIAQLKKGERLAISHLVFVYRHNDRGEELRLTTRIDEDDVTIPSIPPSGNLGVQNMYVDPAAGEVVVESK